VVEIRDNPAVPEQTLFGVSDVVMLTDRRVVAANSQFSQLLVFDSAGTYLEAWGRSGEGPGEFTNLGGLWRFSIFDPSGAFARTETVMGRLTTHAFELEGVAGDCSSILLAVRHTRPPSGPEERRTYRYPTEVFWARLDGSGQVQVDSFPGNEVLTVDVEGTLMGAQFPFAVQPVWGTDGERVIYGPADRHEVQVFDAAGRLERVVRWQASPQPISEEDWARYERWRLAGLEEDPLGAQVPTRADHPSELLPTYSDLLVDDGGNLWVQAYIDRFLLDVEEPPPQQWTVFDAEGRWLGDLTMPSGFALNAVQRGFAIGVARDALDMETIRSLRIRTTPEG
jgi:hypothetical protein